MNSQKDEANLPTSMDNLSIVDKVPAAAAPSTTCAEDRIAPVGHPHPGTSSATPKSCCSAADETSSAPNSATPSCEKAAARRTSSESSTSSNDVASGPSSSSSSSESNPLQAAAAASASSLLRMPDQIGRLAPPATRSAEPLTQRKRDFVAKRRNRMTTSVFSVGIDLLREILQEEVDEGLNPQDSASDLALLDEEVEVERMEARRRAAMAARNTGAEDNNDGDRRRRRRSDSEDSLQLY